jgi:exodeoxyribonuclease V alpha subunit
MQARGALARLDALARFRVLCAHRHGAAGLLALNPMIESALRRAGHIRGSGSLYTGRPILVTRNDYRVGVYNGDLGVIELSTDATRAAPLACFAAPSGLLTVPAARLQPHESVFAMSVHKSQGSELDRVAIVLPAEVSPVLSRELLYTAITRARQGVVLFARPEIVRHAIHTGIQRASGLGERLWAAG